MTPFPLLPTDLERELVDEPMLEDFPRFEGGPREVAVPERRVRYVRVRERKQQAKPLPKGDPRIGVNERILASLKAKEAA
jgi:hypothetical protein